MNYASAIDELARLSILPPDFAANFRAVAGFRNILVHGYLEVDIEQCTARSRLFSVGRRPLRPYWPGL